MKQAQMITYKSHINGIEFDVPADEITNDFLTRPEKQQFISPITDSLPSDSGKVGAGVPPKSGRKQGKVEIE